MNTWSLVTISLQLKQCRSDVWTVLSATGPDEHLVVINYIITVIAV